jgi:release factor glutamine methyltransferase
MTAAALQREAAARLRASGVEAPDGDAERLLRHVLDWDRARLVAHPDATVEAAAETRFRSLVEERARRVPLQHLVGLQAFWRHEFVVTPEVLIPRPETELLVEAALDALRGRERPLLVDVGTGSGCIALSLAAERPDARVHATELSGAALAVARANASRLGLAGRVVFHQGDLLRPLEGSPDAIDVVVSNPPYVDEADRGTLAPEVRDHEPALALFAPEHGLGVYRRLVSEASAALQPGGTLILELGSGQRADVERLCGDAGLVVVRVLPDLQGIPRALVATKRT